MLDFPRCSAPLHKHASDTGFSLRRFPAAYAAGFSVHGVFCSPPAAKKTLLAWVVTLL